MKVSIVQVPEDSEKCLAHFILRGIAKEILLEGIWVLSGSFEERKKCHREFFHKMEKDIRKAFAGGHTWTLKTY